MAIKRLDHVSVVVEDLAPAMAFFTALGMTVEGQAPIEGPWVDRINSADAFTAFGETAGALVGCPLEIASRCGGAGFSLLRGLQSPSYR